ncbi:MAG: galactokinase [Tepidisphaeraceae bacterium]
MERDALLAKFTEQFGPGSDVKFVRAPGRVNLIGEHTDYNDGFVCPMAIEPHILFAYRKRSDQLVRVASMNANGVVEFDLGKEITPTEPREDWSNYVKGIAHQLKKVGVPLSGMDCMLGATLPKGSGLSSSAAMEVGFGTALLDTVGETMDGVRLALLGQKAEHEFPQVPCGIMDQMIVANGKPGSALLLDCRKDASGNYPMEYIPIDDLLRVVVVHSGIGHTLAADVDQIVMPDGRIETGKPYNMRVVACQAGVKAIQTKYPQVKALRDATMKMLDEVALRDPNAHGDAGGFTEHFNEAIYNRCKHVITENERCQKFRDALKKKYFDEAGELMYASHRSLMLDYEVSIGPLDVLVTLARQVPGVYGARMTGAGFGGCIVALVQKDAVDAFKAFIEKQYQPIVGKKPLVIKTAAMAGAKVE